MTQFDCPRCGAILTMAERHGIEIDYCPQCRGVWLDRGELDKIIERATTQTQPAPPPAGGWSQPPQPTAWTAPPAPTRGHGGGSGHGGQHAGRRKNWLSELFD